MRCGRLLQIVGLQLVKLLKKLSGIWFYGGFLIGAIALAKGHKFYTISFYGSKFPAWVAVPTRHNWYSCTLFTRKDNWSTRHVRKDNYYSCTLFTRDVRKDDWSTSDVSLIESEIQITFRPPPEGKCWAAKRSMYASKMTAASRRSTSCSVSSGSCRHCSRHSEILTTLFWISTKKRDNSFIKLETVSTKKRTTQVDNLLPFECEHILQIINNTTRTTYGNFYSFLAVDSFFHRIKSRFRLSKYKNWQRTTNNLSW